MPFNPDKARKRIAAAGGIEQVRRQKEEAEAQTAAQLQLLKNNLRVTHQTRKEIRGIEAQIGAVRKTINAAENEPTQGDSDAADIIRASQQRLDELTEQLGTLRVGTDQKIKERLASDYVRAETALSSVKSYAQTALTNVQTAPRVDQQTPVIDEGTPDSQAHIAVEEHMDEAPVQTPSTDDIEIRQPAQAESNKPEIAGEFKEATSETPPSTPTQQEESEIAITPQHFDDSNTPPITPNAPASNMEEILAYRIAVLERHAETLRERIKYLEAKNAEIGQDVRDLMKGIGDILDDVHEAAQQRDMLSARRHLAGFANLADLADKIDDHIQ